MESNIDLIPLKRFSECDQRKVAKAIKVEKRISLNIFFVENLRALARPND
jgi:hypothetical protein